MGDDEDLTSTIEEQLAEESRDDPQTQPSSEETQPLSAQDLKDPAVEPHSEDEIAEENAESALDQPSDDVS
ncbi:hypothetical protein [Nocardioides marmorisolisilvae]|uniref:Uncharacterized protein n=1 Tax=Nocardioides marmorisolisilvae TaxID=1542737 RepID=A0A3N0DS56_9ACTN|nr:hypothetical protein [Nocardioides marmorisolisilvae]RNL78450.1 hypothetical protein EFL95_04955 [Nocardioides marmorisolisilvae]